MADAERHNTAGNAAYKTGRYQEAAAHYSEAIKADESVAKYRTNRANALWKSGRVLRVLADAEAAVQLDPTWLKGHYYRGVALERMGRFGEAVQSLKAARELELSELVAVALHRCQESLRQQLAFCMGRVDPLTQLVRQSSAHAHKAICASAGDRWSSNSRIKQLIQAYAAVTAGDQLCVDAACVLRGDVTHAKQQFAAAASKYRLAADMGCAAGMYNCAVLLRLGLAEEMLPDGTPAVNTQAAQRYISNAMQQEQPMMSIPVQCAAGAGAPSGGFMEFRIENVGAPECHVLAGDMQRDGVWGVAAASLQDALATYSKAACPPPHPAAQAAIGWIKEMQGDLEAAKAWYRKAAEEEYSLGELGIAKLLAQAAEAGDDASLSVRRDKQAALAAAMRAVQLGWPRAKAVAATLEEDDNKAAALLLQAVEEDGHPECLLLLAMGYGHGQYGFPQDYAKAQQLLLQAAVDEGWPDAMDILGNAYAGGQYGFQANPVKALPLFEHAAILKVPAAMYKTAGAYLAGIGVKPSLSKASLWAQCALQAAPNAVAKKDAAKLLADIQDKERQFGESAWAAMLQMHWGCMQDSVIGPSVAEAMSRDDEFNEEDRERYKSFVMSVAQHAGGPQPAAAAAAATAAASNAGAAASSSQQASYPSSAAFAKALGVASSVEDGRRSEAVIVAFLGFTVRWKLSGEQQRRQQAQELLQAALDAIIGQGLWDVGIQAMAAGYCLYPAAMQSSRFHTLSALREAVYVYTIRHPGRPEGLIVHAFLEANRRGLPWLVQQLEGVIPRVADPVLRGLLLLVRCQWHPFPDQALAQWQGASADAEAGLLLLPEHPDLLFMRAWAINAVRYNPLAAQEVDLSDRSSSRVQDQLARRQTAAAQTAAAYERFLDAAPDVHRHKPAALYYLAYIPLNEAMVAGRPGANVINKSQALYDMARVAEAQLPEEWLPVNCAVREKVPMYLALGRSASDVDAAAPGNTRNGSSSSRSSSTAAAASKTQKDRSGGAASTRRRNTRQEETSDGVGPGASANSSSSKSTSHRSAGSSSSKGSCAACGVCGVKLRKCSGCQQVAYCNRECQTAHWKEHKKNCSRQ